MLIKNLIFAGLARLCVVRRDEVSMQQKKMARMRDMALASSVRCVCQCRVLHTLFTTNPTSTLFNSSTPPLCSLVRRKSVQVKSSYQVLPSEQYKVPCRKPSN